jgi:hypothetical protein
MFFFIIPLTPPFKEYTTAFGLYSSIILTANKLLLPDWQTKTNGFSVNLSRLLFKSAIGISIGL